MLVDNPLLHPSYFAATSAQPSSSEYPTDFSDIFDTDLFNSTFEVSSSTSPASQGSSPKNLLTPPQEALPTSFPEVYEDFFQYDDPSADFMGVNVFDPSYGGPSGGGVNYNNIGYDASNMRMNIPPIDDPIQMSIDPQLVDTPSAATDEQEEEQDPPSVPQRPEQEKLTLTIAPVKVGGFGKARKGTVQSGGVVKKTPNPYVNKDKENPSIPSSKKPAGPPKPTKQTPPTALPKVIPASGLFLTGGDSNFGGSEAGDGDDDDLPQDWRPPPEVLAKMTSKEKRQLRNKISARNFRVRRKEYITTLEGDIAERDRLLDHFRTVLGSQESENLALRQEIAALKKALLDGHGGSINLPPPAPLPEQSAAETLAASNANVTAVPSSPLLTANTQKDLPSSPRIGGSRFWGGVGMGGGVTPVHTTIVPDISTIVRNGLQENMNPSLNAMRDISTINGIGPNKTLGGFDGFADLNPFTMKTLDAYRMHLWGKMAAQQQMQQHQNQTLQNHLQNQNSSGLASNLRPHFFNASPKANLPPPSGYGSTLSALLSGKHNVPYSTSSASSAYLTPPPSPSLLPKGGISPSSSSSSSLSSSQKEQQHAMLAAMASQTLFRKLGSAVWDAFIGSPPSHSSSASSSSSSSRGDWDADKVRKILEGKAVLRVVDVEPATTVSSATAVAAAATSASLVSSTTPSASSPKWTGVASRSSSLGQCQSRSSTVALATMSSAAASSSNQPHAAAASTEDGSGGSGKKCCKTKAAVCDILEESMRGLSLGKK